MKPLEHVMILASAGSGKTYALTNRFVGLLARGAKPERIVALTFTRKAAGEFFDEILQKLARAARDADFAQRLARDLGMPELARADFLRMLRGMADAMHRLHLGTLDSFFARIARAFPLELGLNGDFEVLQEHGARRERQRVLQRMFARAPNGLDAAQREFVEAFKRATFGVEEKRLGARLDGLLDAHHETFLATAAAGTWGDPGRIWPEGCVWLAPARKPLADAVNALRTLLARRELSEKQAARWEAFFAQLPEWAPGAPLPGPLEYVLKNALAVWRDVQCGGAEMTVERKKLALGRDECAELATIVQHLVCAELTRRIETTRGIHAVLRGYETVYHDAVRREGKLTFADVQRLLAPVTLTRAADDHDTGERRLFVDFRLDAQFDHWLLDEFQDTSFGQWSVLRNLIDEVVQDSSRERTFFCVGDVKQAIYTWREGDPRLFREIFEHYNRMAPDAIVERHLVQSWRSGPAVIELVNAVFGRGDVLAGLFPGEASATWNREWRTHESARPQLASHAAWLHAPATGEGRGADEMARFALTLRVLQEIAPLERGLDCAVLTQTNGTATALADYLRREGGIPAVAESDLHVNTDNPLTVALLALVQTAAHPGDTLAREHVNMTPLRGALAAQGLRAPEDITRRVLHQVHTGGFERTMEFWLRALEPVLAADDAFSRERGRQLVAAAALFDATGSRDIAEFLAFMERHAVRDAELAGVVRVMTIHKSKGLGFDVVVLPDLEGQRIDQRRPGLAVQRSPERAVQWVLELPPKLFYAQDETLEAHVRAAEAEACYEALSLLYVALTRAKRGLYVITQPPRDSESRNYPKLLASALGDSSGETRVGRLHCAGGWTAGDPDWHANVSAPSETMAPAKPAWPSASRWTRVPRLPSRRASATKGGIVSAQQLFALEGGAASGFGTEVHDLLAQIMWSGTTETAELLAGWSDGGPAEQEALACVRAPALADVWRRRGEAEVWKERSFEIVLDGTWLTGVFDRVIVERTAGRPVRARVVDFKTDRIADEAALREATTRHAAQVDIYRRAAAVLLGLPREAVSGELVFTRVQRSVPVSLGSAAEPHPSATA